MHRFLLLSAAAAALVAGSISAQACGVRPDVKTAAVKLPRMAIPAAEAAPQGYGSIVGVWNNSVIIGGNTVLTSIATWHGDGTMFDNVDLPPQMGNICHGVWANGNLRKVTEHHLGWTFDSSGNPTGSFTLVQTVKLSRDGLSYSGPFDQKIYDTNGNLVNELTGTMSATRFTGQ